MTIFIKDLETGNEIIALMRTGYALQRIRSVRGKISGRVPPRAKVAKSWDITSLGGLVLINDTVNCSLRVQFGKLNHKGMLIEQINGEYLVADVPYWAFQTIRLLSPISFEPQPLPQQFPTYNDLVAARPKPYRTYTLVVNPHYKQTVVSIILDSPIITENNDILNTEDDDVLTADP